jgi:hypothetical protein
MDPVHMTGACSWKNFFCLTRHESGILLHHLLHLDLLYRNLLLHQRRDRLL